MGKGPGGQWGGGVILEFFTMGGQSHFTVGGGWGKNFFDHFLPFYETLTNFLQYL